MFNNAAPHLQIMNQQKIVKYRGPNRHIYMTLTVLS